MTLAECKTLGLEVFFLATEAEATAFAAHLAHHTGRETGTFTEQCPVGKLPPFTFHCVTVQPRKGTVVFTQGFAKQ